MTHEVSASWLAEETTRQIAKAFKRSRPQPRAKAMGLRDDSSTWNNDKPKNNQLAALT